jgi:hypothetical protein
MHVRSSLDAARHDAVVDVQLLLIPECPGGDEAARLLRTALDDIGLTEMPFTVRIIDTNETAPACNFAGSPAFIVDGTDLFATEDPRSLLACPACATCVRH